jgi:mercuric ion binding protein
MIVLKVKFVQNLNAMKKLLFLSFSLSIFFFSCGDTKTSTNEAELIEIPIPQNKIQKEVLAENKVEVKMEVEGMTCAMGCAKFIQDKVGGMDGIVTSTVNFENKIATFEFDKSTTTPEAIQQFINNIHEGQYKAKTLTSDATIDSEASDKEDESVASVAERINISFPDLFTYFIKRIR